jgi:hypothetical protein
MNGLKRLKIINIFHPCKPSDQALNRNLLNIRVHITLTNPVFCAYWCLTSTDLEKFETTGQILSSWIIQKTVKEQVRLHLKNLKNTIKIHSHEII